MKTLTTKHLVLFCCMLSVSCSHYLHPYVYPPVSSVCSVGNGACGQFTQTSVSLTNIVNASKEIENKLNYRSSMDGILNLTTFFATLGLAGGVATGASLTDASSLLLAVTAGATKSADLLFFPRTIEGVYLSGYFGLYCMANHSNSLISLLMYKQRQFDDINNHLGECQKNSSEVNLRRASVQALLGDKLLLDGDISSQINNSVAAILLSMNRELLESKPDPNAVLASARKLIPAPEGIASEVGMSFGNIEQFRGKLAWAHSEIAKGLLDNPPTKIHKCESEKQQSINKAVINLYDEIQKSLTGERDRLNNALDQCLAGFTNTLRVMKISPTEITLMQNSKAEVHVLDARGELAIYPIGTTLPKGLTFTLDQDKKLVTLNFTSSTAVVETRKYAIVIYDKSVWQQQAELSITISR